MSNKNIAFPKRGICIISDKQVGWRGGRGGGGGGPKDNTEKKKSDDSIMDNPGCTMLNLGDFFFSINGTFCLQKEESGKAISQDG